MIHKFIKNNLALVLGLALPLLLVIFMILASLLPRLWIDPPQYSLLYASNLYTYGPISMYVNEGKLHLRFTTANYQNTNPPRLFIFNPKTKQRQEISFKFPKVPASTSDKKVFDYLLPETGNLKLDPSVSAPDGYEYLGGSDYGSGLAFLIFSSPRAQFSIGKRGNIISLPEGNARDSYGPTFLGWIIPGESSQ